MSGTAAHLAGDGPRGLAGIADPVERRQTFLALFYSRIPAHPGESASGPVEDCYAALAWTAENAERLGIDPERIVIYGGSAGGGLAAGTALLGDAGGGASTPPRSSSPTPPARSGSSPRGSGRCGAHSAPAESVRRNRPQPAVTGCSAG